MEAGARVEYYHGGDWKKGVVHGVRTYESGSGVINRRTYLIDTGHDERVDRYPIDVRGREIDTRINKLVAQGAEFNEAAEQVYGHKDLPTSELIVEEVRQPLQVEVDEYSVRPLE